MDLLAELRLLIVRHAGGAARHRATILDGISITCVTQPTPPTAVMAEAPHGTAPSLVGKNVANPMAMLLACAAVLDYAAGGDAVVARTSAAIRAATLGAAADGIRTFDLGGDQSTSEVVDEVLRTVVSLVLGFGRGG